MQIVRVKTEAAKRLEVALTGIANKVGKVGWFAGSEYENGVKVALVAAVQEYGYPAGNIPPRPFMRPTIAKQQKEWAGIAQRGAKEILRGSQTSAGIMEAIGLKAAGDIRKMISAIWSPPLSPRTIQARLSRRANKTHIGNLDKPLIDTGIMFGTLTNTVEDA